MAFDNSKFYNGSTTQGGVSGMGSPDVWWAWNFTHSNINHHFRITLSVNYKDWGNDRDKPLSQFIHQHEDIFAPLGPGGAGNDTVNPASLRYAAQGIANVRTWLSTWYPRVQGWAEKINGSDSDWQGDAAGEFKLLLKRYALEMETIRLQLDKTPYEADLYAAADQIGRTIGGLRDAHYQWYAAWERVALPRHLPGPVAGPDGRRAGTQP